MGSLLLVLPILTFLMFGLGLGLERSHFLGVVREPRAALVGLFAQIVIVPALAFAIAAVLSLDPVFAVGLILIASCPGGSSSNVLTKLVGGNVALSITLTTVASFLSIITMPLVLWLATRVYFSQAQRVEISWAQTLIQILILILVPVSAGMWVRARNSSWANRAEHWIRRWSMPLLALMIVAFIVKQRSVIGEYFASLIAAIGLLVASAIFCGQLICRIFRIDGPSRRAITMEMAIQNAALGISVAVSPYLLNSEAIAVPSVLYAVVMNVVAFGYVGIRASFVRVREHEREYRESPA